MQYNFYAGDHKANSDSRFSERVEFTTHEEARKHAVGLCNVWKCPDVAMKEIGGRTFYIGEV